MSKDEISITCYVCYKGMDIVCWKFDVFDIFESCFTKIRDRIYFHKLCDSLMRKISFQYYHVQLSFTVIFSLFYQNLSDNQVLSFFTSKPSICVIRVSQHIEIYLEGVID